MRSSKRGTLLAARPKDAPGTPPRRPPRWPTALLALFAVLATVSLAQGIVDVVLPTLRGERPFGFLFEMSSRYGPVFFGAYIFVHNLGLACLVPGYGFLAAWFEKRTANRALIGAILAGAVAFSLLTALTYIVRAPERFDLAVSVPLFLGEAASVLVMALLAARELRGFVPTRAYDWSLMTPFRRLRVPFVASAALLAVLAAFEAVVVLG